MYLKKCELNRLIKSVFSATSDMLSSAHILITNHMNYIQYSAWSVAYLVTDGSSIGSQSCRTIRLTCKIQLRSHEGTENSEHFTIKGFTPYTRNKTTDSIRLLGTLRRVMR